MRGAVLRAAILGMLGILAMGGAVRAEQTPAGDEPIGPGYRLQSFHGELKADPFQLYLLIRLADENGKLKVCGAYVADMSDRRFNTMAAELRDPNSFLRVGAADKSGYPVRPGFLAAKRAIVIDGLDGRPKLPVADLRANCVVTDGIWEPRFATEPFALQLRVTRFHSRLRQW